MTCFRYLLLVAFLGAAVTFPAWVAAKSCAPVMDVRWGFLGSFPDEQDVEAPRNVAVVHNPELLDISAWPPTNVPVVEHSVDGLWRPETPLPPGTPLESITQTVITTDAIDTEAPTAIELLSVSTGGSIGGCFGSLRVDAAASRTDDQTPGNRLVYAVYAGSTRAEAMESPARVALVLYSLIPDPGLPWVAISVLDQAGNESPRSEAVEVIQADSGCSASRPSPASSSTTFLALGLFLFTVIRRRGSASLKNLDVTE
jgi:MYXO-CTERM domain-containing protein